MVFWTFVFVLFYFSSSNALKCVHLFKPLTIERGNFYLYNIEDKVRALTTSKDEVCRVEINVIYQQRRIEIRFDKAFNAGDLVRNTQIHMRSTMIVTNSITTAQTMNTLQFTCDYSDECDRQFFFDHINWLFDSNFSVLTNTIAPLLVNHTATGTVFLYETKYPLSRASCSIFYSLVYNGE